MADGVPPAVDLEDACIEGLIDYDPSGDRIVRASQKGRALLEARLERQSSPAGQKSSG